MSEHRPVRIETERLIIRTAQVEDAGILLRFYEANAEFLDPWRPTRQPESTKLDYWLRQIESWRREWQLDLGLRLWLFDRTQPSELVGHVGLTVFVRGPAQFCYLGYHLSRSSEGRGLMYEGLKAILDYTFSEIHLHRVMANYMPRNGRSARLLERLGFEIEGFARGYLKIAGRWEDHVMTSLSNPNPYLPLE